MSPPPTVAELLDGLRREERRSHDLLHMVPSENVLSPRARAAYAGTLQARYSFGDGGLNPSWPAMDWFERVERDTEEELAALLGADRLSARPLSGMNAMAVALAASGAADVVSVAVSDGGHAVTSQMARKLGARVHNLPLNPCGGGIDVAAAARDVERLPGPVLIYVDEYCTVRPLRVAGLAALVPPTTVIHYDASHILGLVAGGAVANPLADGAHSIGGSLHKSFPGPHRGVLATNDDTVHEAFRAESARWVSHHHPGHTLALAITLAELRDGWRDYAASVVGNARAFAESLFDLGVPVYGSGFGFTECHQVFIDVAEIMDPRDAAGRLLEAGIRMNAIDIPQLRRGGLRAGLQELTRRGLDEPGARGVAGIVAAAVRGDGDPVALRTRSRSIVERLTWTPSPRDAAAVRG
jgi:glycine hydroxymethyltransferase